MPKQTPPDTREPFMDLYRDLYGHTSFLEDALERMIHRQRVERPQLESHLAQILAAISVTQKRHPIQRFTRKVNGMHPDPFHNQMVKVTKVVREQTSILLKASFLVEKGDPGLEYIQTLSDVHDNILGAFQHVLRSNVLIPVVLN
jgi:hypothetical protein